MLLFHFLCYAEAFWVRCSPTFLFLLLLSLLSNPKNYLWDLHQGACYLCFFLEFYGRRSFIKVLNPFWVNFCLWCKTVVQFHSFACEVQLSHHQLLKILFFSHCMFLAALLSVNLPYTSFLWSTVKYRVWCMCGFMCWLSILFCWSLVCFFANGLLQLCNRSYILKSGKARLQALWFFLKISSLFGSFVVPYQF